MQRLMHVSTQIGASILIAIFTFASSILVTRELSYSDRASYGILTVLLAQGFILIQGGLPGSINTLGFGPFVNSTKSEVTLFGMQRIVPIVFVSVLLCYLYNLPSFTFILTSLTYSLLAIYQWISNGLQKFVTNLEYAFIRMISATSFLVLLIVQKYLSEFSFEKTIIAWFLSISIGLTYSVIRLKRLSFKIDLGNTSLKDLKSYARKGFIAHISFQDLFRLETLVIPFLLSEKQVALYFAVLGLSQWPKVIIDGIANGSIQRYPSMGKLQAFKAGQRTMNITFVSLMTISLITIPFQTFLIQKMIGDIYPAAADLYLLLMLSSILNYARRLQLDALRTHSPNGAVVASKIEILIGSLVSMSIIFLFVTRSLNLWAIALLSFSALGFVINKQLTKFCVIHEK